MFVGSYLSGVANINSSSRTGNHLRYQYASSTLKVFAVTDGNFNVNGTLNSYAAGATIISVAWNAAQQYVVWRESDN